MRDHEALQVAVKQLEADAEAAEIESDGVALFEAARILRYEIAPDLRDGGLLRERAGVLSTAVGLARLALQGGAAAKAQRYLDQAAERCTLLLRDALIAQGNDPDHVEQFLGIDRATKKGTERRAIRVTWTKDASVTYTSKPGDRSLAPAETNEYDELLAAEIEYDDGTIIVWENDERNDLSESDVWDIIHSVTDPLVGSNQ